MAKIIASVLFTLILGLPIWGVYQGYLYIENLPNQWHQEKVGRAISSATTGLKYIRAGEKGIGCMELRFSYLRLIELNAESDAKEIKEGYNQFCR